jgi:hypothetical protein
MESKTSTSNQEISNEGYQKHTIVLILQTIPYALDTQKNKQQVGHGINNLCGIDSGIVILFAPINGTRNGMPKSILGWRILDMW